MGWGRTLALGAVALAASPGAAFASTIAVTTTADETTPGDGTCSLREAITAVNSPAAATDCATAAFGPNTIVLSAKRYALSITPSGADENASGDLNLTGTGSDVTITGAGEAATTIDASGVGDRVVHVAAGASMTLTALTITGGRAPQGLAGANGDRFQPPFTGAAGPGTAGASGGAILNDGTTELRDMAVTNSRAGSGGQGGAAQTNDLTPGTSGGAGGSGGAVFNSSSGTLTLTGVTLSGNVAGDGGAGGTVQGGSGSLCSTGGVGGAGGNGGALAGAAGAVTVAASTFSGNGAGNGGSGALGRGGCGAGGVGGVGGAGGSGGAIYQVGSMSLVNSTLVGNGAGAGGIGGGGGDHNTGPGPGGGGGGNGGVGGDAGGIEFVTGPDTVQNATVVGGSAGAGGAGGPSGVPSDPTRPSGPPGSPGAAGAAGGLLRNGAAVTLTNTIIASNAGGNCAPAGSFANGGHDFSFPDATCPGSNANPDLEALQDNGGPTQTTGLQPGSPAIDAVPAGGAGCPASDQRGVSRPQGPGCDSGAFEAAAPLNTAPPSLAGTAAVGSTITCAVGTWGNFPLSFRYAWTRDGVAIPGAASATYVVTAADAGHRLGCTVTAINGNGSISAQTTTILVPLLTPALSPLRLRPTAFSAAGRGGSIARRRRASKVTGTTIDYSDSLAARTTFTVQRPRRGFTRRGSCVVPGRRGPAKGAKRCTAWLAVGSFAHDDLAGANRLHFTGRLGKRKLAPGSYRLLAVARLGAAASAPRQAGFRIRQ